MEQILEQMEKYSDSLQFEKAAKLRDSYNDLKKTLEKQKVVYENTKLNEDVISMLYDGGIYAIVILMIREGRLIDKKDFIYEVEDEDRAEFFATFFKDYYNNLQLEFPDRIVSNELETEKNALASRKTSLLNEKSLQNWTITNPKYLDSLSQIK